MYIKACKLKIIKDLFDPFDNPYINQSGLYFLYDQDELVYIGKSTVCLKSRVADHRRDGIKKFDKAIVYVINGKSNVTLLEHYFIALYKPRYNIEFVYGDELLVKIENVDKFMKNKFILKEIN